jgi:2-desacetyl-2-hydroxyethyl bacteriochlorophyllide A dehydrogenase
MNMKYISIPKPGIVEIKETEMPALQPGNALLRLQYGGICGSDLGTYRGSFLYTKYPRIPGHEFSAEIVEVGANDRGLKKGMIVTANPYFNCGECYSCTRGHVNCCVSNQTLGAQRDGAFMQYISMPVERIYDGKGLSPKVLALIEPFCISYHAVKRGKVKPGDNVLVVGSGTIGCLAATAAKLAGARVYVSDISEGKLEYAKKLGVDGVFVNSSEEAFKEKVQQITDGKSFDVCIEAVGLPVTFKNCIDAAAYRARVVIVGIGKQSLDFFYSIIQTKELDIFGSRNALKEDFIELIDIVKAGKVDLELFISDVYEYTEAQSAFEDLSTRGADKLKVLLKFC